MTPRPGRTHPSSRRALLRLGALALLAACAGGGDGGGLPTEPSTPSLGTALTSGGAVANLSGAEGSTKLYRITVPAGATLLEVRTSGGTGDLDLYVRRGQAPAPGSTVDCESEGDFTDERCAITSPAAGDWYVLIVGFEPYAGVTLTATVSGGSTTTPTGGNASFMSARLLTPPGVGAGAAVVGMKVTNAGVYLQYFEDDVPDRVVRFESGASLTNGWTTFQPGFGIVHFAPASLTLEPRNTFSAYWVQHVFSCNYPQGEKVGLWVVNTGVPSADWQNDVCATALVPSSSEQTTLAHSWIVAAQHGTASQPRSGFYVEQAQQQADDRLSGSYRKVADLVDYSALATSPKDNALWVGSLGTLYEIQEDGTRRTYDLTPYGGTTSVDKLQFQGSETLWIGYGSRILRMRNGTIDKQFTDVVPSMGGISQFCVQGNTIYLTTGTRIDVATGQRRSYIADREVAQMSNQADVQKYMELLQKTVGMLDCSPAGTSGVLYSAGSEGVYEIAAK